MKILISGGGTIEPIDQMRVISNFSTGSTALKLAHYLAKNHQVTLFMAKKSLVMGNFLTEAFETVTDLSLLYQEYSKEEFDLIIHAAAISDYCVDRIEYDGRSLDMAKIPSGLPELSIKLKPTVKVINTLKKLFPKTTLVGFKLTSEQTPNEVKKSVIKVFESGADFIVHNDLKTRRSGKDLFSLYHKNLKATEIQGIEQLADNLINCFYKEELSHDSLS